MLLICLDLFCSLLYSFCLLSCVLNCSNFYDTLFVSLVVWEWQISFLELLVDSLGEGSGTHSSTLAWKIPWMEEPGGPQSMGLLRVGHDWATSISLFTFMHWRRKWQPTPVFLPGESQGRGSLVGCRLWGRTESDTTEWLSSGSSR